MITCGATVAVVKVRVVEGAAVVEINDVVGPAFRTVVSVRVVATPGTPVINVAGLVRPLLLINAEMMLAAAMISAPMIGAMMANDRWGLGAAGSGDATTAGGTNVALGSGCSAAGSVVTPPASHTFDHATEQLHTNPTPQLRTGTESPFIGERSM
jgi:hypothetical protein